MSWREQLNIIKGLLAEPSTKKEKLNNNSKGRSRQKEKHMMEISSLDGESPYEVNTQVKQALMIEKRQCGHSVKPMESRNACSNWSMADQIPQDIAFEPASNNENMRAKLLVIGLDFGTAFTKVVVGDVTYAYAVPFDKNDYLLPSLIYIDRDGICSLKNDNAIDCLSDLKLPIILSKATDKDYFAIIVFLAAVFHHCREWVLTDTTFRGFKINWLVNAGLPSASFENNAMTVLYKRLITTAWSLSHAINITINAARYLWKSDLSAVVPSHVRLSPDYLYLFPEFAVQILGYVQSPARRQFAHLLVDVGAGTLDVAMFTVKNLDGDWQFNTYGQQVRPLGVDMLYRHRLQMINSTESLHNINRFSEEEFAKHFGITMNRLHEIDSPFIASVADCVYDTLRDTDNHYCGGPAGRFTQPITTFLCGGGASVKVYSDILKHAPERYPISRLSLPKPPRLVSKNIKDDIYHRLSVAYGLSFEPYDIGQIIKQQPDVQYDHNTQDSFNPSDYRLNDD